MKQHTNYDDSDSIDYFQEEFKFSLNLKKV